MKLGVICQGCGREAPCKKVSFHQNIGMLVARRYKTITGFLCRDCINKNFWPMTGTTLAVGWLGTISLVVAPAFVINNIVYYLGALRLPKVPPDAKVPVVDNRVAQAVFPAFEEIANRLNAKEDFNDVARDVAGRVGVTPGEVQAYVREMIRAQRQPPPPPRIGGFPVIPVPPPLPPSSPPPSR